MANVAGPFGLVVSGTFSGPVNFAEFHNPPFRIASNYGTAIGYGDLVTLVAGGSPTGYLNQWIAGDGSATYQVAGVFVGCKYYSTSQRKTVWNNYWPGSDATGDVDAFVISDPNAQFVIQTAAGPTTQAMIGTTADIVVGTVNTTTGWSGAALDVPSTSNPTTLPLKILGLVTSPPGANGTDVTTAYNNAIVGFNNQIFKSLATIHS